MGYFIDAASPLKERSVSGTTYSTSALGWTEDTDVGASGEMSDLISLLSDGDTVIVDGHYDLTGNYNTTAITDLTFRAGSPGSSGFNLLDGHTGLATANGVPFNNNPVFRVGDGFMADGLLFHQAEVFDGGTTNKTSFFTSSRKAGFYLMNCTFNVQCYPVIRAEYSSNVIVARCRFDSANGFGDAFESSTALYVTACDGMVVIHNDTSRGSDFIKTVKGNDPEDRTVEGALIAHNYCHDQGRDFIDTTGGFRNCIVSDNVVISPAISFIDLKSPVNDMTDYNLGPSYNDGTRLIGNYYRDTLGRNAIVLTFNWYIEGVEPDWSYAPGPIYSSGNTFDCSGTTGRACLNKGCRKWVSTNDTFIGVSTIIGDSDTDFGSWEQSQWFSPNLIDSGALPY